MEYFHQFTGKALKHTAWRHNVSIVSPGTIKYNPDVAININGWQWILSYIGSTIQPHIYRGFRSVDMLCPINQNGQLPILNNNAGILKNNI